jgi:phospholipase C
MATLTSQRWSSHRTGGLVVAASFAVVVVLALPAYGLHVSPPLAPSASKMSLFDAHIDHIVFLMQENHAYDNLYGVYCLNIGPYCPMAANGIPPNTCVPVNPAIPTIGCIPPYNFTDRQLNLPVDLPHNWNSSHLAWNHGAMNGFWIADGYNSLGHYNSTEDVVEYDLAEQYGLGDDFFSGALTYSLSNHWYLVSSAPPNDSFQNFIDNVPPSVQDQYLNQSNHTGSIESALLNSTVSWKYYDFNLSTYQNATAHVLNATAYAYWNPLAAKAQSYAPKLASHFALRSTFFSDAANGTLPSISWVIPRPTNSEHPPYNLTNGENWEASVVDALEASPEWNSTVLFISWDEYGGFYDHVDPPMVDANGDGFRVPLLAIGPWVRQGFVDHENLSFSSITHLMEERFHLGCMGPRDCNASLPLSMFDFNRAHPRPPIYFPPYGIASYPMPLQSSGQIKPFAGPFVPFPNPPYQPPASAFQGIDWS